MNLAEARVAVGEHSPIFEAPPVVETALGVRFTPIEGFTVVHFGQLLDVYRETYDRFELKPPLGSGFELRIDPQAASFNIPLRCWYINADDTQLVQVQNDLFIRNWRATAERTEYQHYDSIKPLFKRDWNKFCVFLDKHGLQRPNIWQCEVTYINHLVRGREWRTFNDLPDLFPLWRGVDQGALFKTIEMASFCVGFKLPDEDSHVQFALQPGVRRDGIEILQLTVNALGKPPRQDDATLLDWLDYGHLAVVNGFLQFTSEKAHAIWRMK